MNIDRAIVIVDELLDNNAFPNFFTDFCHQCIPYTSGDTLFRDLLLMDFHLDTNSVAERKAFPIPYVTDDLDGAARDAVTPDLGCYEFID